MLMLDEATTVTKPLNVLLVNVIPLAGVLMDTGTPMVALLKRTEMAEAELMPRLPVLPKMLAEPVIETFPVTVSAMALDSKFKVEPLFIVNAPMETEEGEPLNLITAPVVVMLTASPACGPAELAVPPVTVQEFASSQYTPVLFQV